MVTLLVIILILSPIACCFMVINQKQLYKSIVEIKDNIKHIDEVNSLNNDNTISKTSNTIESISTNEDK